MNIPRISSLFFTVAFCILPDRLYAQTVTDNVKDVAAQHLATAKSLIEIVIGFLVNYGFQVLGGIVVLMVGWWIAKYLAKVVGDILGKKHVDVTVTKFVVGTVKLMVIAFAGVVAIGKFGIEIAPLIAGVSVAGFGLSFALQGPLSNYASGATLIFTKPFKVGDIIEVAGVTGEVRDMKLPCTELKTLDGEMIVVPNKHIIGEIIHNYSGFKRLDIRVGVSYKTDIGKAIFLVSGIIKSEPRIANDKDPKVGLEEFGDSSLNIYARAWCKQDDYWELLFSINSKIIAAFRENDIEIPFPQRDVHMISG